MQQHTQSCRFLCTLLFEVSCTSPKKNLSQFQPFTFNITIKSLLVFAEMDGKILKCFLLPSGFTFFGLNIKPLNPLYILLDRFAVVKIKDGGILSCRKVLI